VNKKSDLGALFLEASSARDVKKEMKKLIVSLVPAVALFCASSLLVQAGTEMETPAAPPQQNYTQAPGYWVPPPPAYYPPPAPYYAGPPPYYYGPGPGYYYGPGYYGPGVSVGFFGPGLFFGFGHGRR
jgi:hypothetical protein